MADTMETVNPNDDSSSATSSHEDEVHTEEEAHAEDEVVDDEEGYEDEVLEEEYVGDEGGEDVVYDEEEAVSASEGEEESGSEGEHEAGDSEAEEEGEEVEAARSSPDGDVEKKAADTDDGSNECVSLICCLLFFAAIVAAIAIPLRLRADGGGTNIRATSGDTGGGGSPVASPTGSPGAPTATSPPGTPTATSPPGTPTATSPPGTPTATSPPVTSPTIAPGGPSTTPPTSVNLGLFLENFLIPRFGEEPFQDPNSPTYKAADHMANDDPYIFSGPVTSEEELGDRYASTLLYYTLGGEEWPNCGLDSTTCPGNNWLEGDHCTWISIDCSDNGRVIAVELSSSFTGTELEGTIPPEISLYTELEELIIENEMISGKIPPTLPAGMTSLQLGGNSLTGFWPDELLDLTELTNLDLSGNAMNGPLPFNIDRMEALEQLLLAENAFSGTVPTTFGDLTNLGK
eukprot:scaffold25143_cov142-Cylindrotheca_fusiformis.AAC.2